MHTLHFKAVTVCCSETSPTLSLIWNVKFSSAWPGALQFGVNSVVHQMQSEGLNLEQTATTHRYQSERRRWEIQYEYDNISSR